MKHFLVRNNTYVSRHGGQSFEQTAARSTKMLSVESGNF